MSGHPAERLSVRWPVAARAGERGRRLLGSYIEARCVPFLALSALDAEQRLCADVEELAASAQEFTCALPHSDRQSPRSVALWLLLPASAGVSVSATAVDCFCALAKSSGARAAVAVGDEACGAVARTLRCAAGVHCTGEAWLVVRSPARSLARKVDGTPSTASIRACLLELARFVGGAAELLLHASGVFSLHSARPNEHARSTKEAADTLWSTMFQEAALVDGMGDSFSWARLHPSAAQTKEASDRDTSIGMLLCRGDERRAAMQEAIRSFWDGGKTADGLRPDNDVVQDGFVCVVRAHEFHVQLSDYAASGTCAGPLVGTATEILPLANLRGFCVYPCDVSDVFSTQRGAHDVLRSLSSYCARCSSPGPDLKAIPCPASPVSDRPDGARSIGCLLEDPSARQLAAAVIEATGCSLSDPVDRAISATRQLAFAAEGREREKRRRIAAEDLLASEIRRSRAQQQQNPSQK